METLFLALIALGAYLLGSFSTGILVSGKKDVDIRSLGSHNTGASNVTRVMGLGWGLVTFGGDAAKTALSCLLSLLLLPSGCWDCPALGLMVAGLFSVVGHNWPVYYGFKGGKGVACSLCAILFVNPTLGLVSVLLCVLVIALTRYISLGSLTMLFSFFLLNLLNCLFQWGGCFRWFYPVFGALLLVFGVIRHRENLGRLLRGEERKLGERA